MIEILVNVKRTEDHAYPKTVPVKGNRQSFFSVIPISCDGNIVVYSLSVLKKENEVWISGLGSKFLRLEKLLSEFAKALADFANY